MDTQPTREQIEAQVHIFVEKLTTYYADEFKVRYQNVLTPPKFVAQISRKFTRIVKLEPGDRYGSVYCFIDMENGDLRKAAGFKAPAPHKRGSIFNDNCDVGNGKPADMHGSGLYLR